jgi:hypothetical protein
VFPTRTSMTPTDEDAYYSEPDLFTKRYGKVMISTTFTWDKTRAEQLRQAWMDVCDDVQVGGVAIDGESDQPFEAGLFLKKGITITSRGCPNNCGFCVVRKGLIEFDEFPEGNIIQDNNILACSDRHWQLVLSMLRKQKAIEFKGGLDKYRVTSKISEDLRGLRIKTLWLACDQPQGIEPLRKAVEILWKSGFRRDQLRCYVLIGKDRFEEESRLRECFNLITYYDEDEEEKHFGVLPFAQLYRDKDGVLNYSKEWKQFARTWSRPAAYKTLMKV